MCKILQVKKFPLFDVFSDDGKLDDTATHGWRNWSRVKVTGEDITVISGMPLNDKQLFKVHQQIKGMKA